MIFLILIESAGFLRACHICRKNCKDELLLLCSQDLYTNRIRPESTDTKG